MIESKAAGTIFSASIPRLLILGGGAVVRELHIPALERLTWCAAATVLDVSDRVVAELRELYPDLSVSQDNFREVLRVPQTQEAFDGVVIALPNHMHEEAVALSLEAGLPVLCEKPLANESETCRRLDRIARHYNRPLSVAMVRRLVPWVCATRNALRGGLIGDLELITIEHGGRFQWPTQSETYFSKEHGGLLVNMGVHYLDKVEDWVGPLTPLEYEDDFEGGVEANFAFRLRTENGVRVHLRLSYTDQLENKVILCGSKGKITADVNFSDERAWQSHEMGTTAILRSTKPFRSGDWPKDLISCFVEQFHEFYLVIQGEDLPRVSASSSAGTLKLIEWGYRNRRNIFSAPGPRRARPGLRWKRRPRSLREVPDFIGGKLVERLAELRLPEVRVLMRSVMTSANVARFQVQRIHADLLDYQRTELALKGVRYVFHLAYGTTEATVLGTRNVVEAAIAVGAEVVVVVSTASVFPACRAPLLPSMEIPVPSDVRRVRAQPPGESGALCPPSCQNFRGYPGLLDHQSTGGCMDRAGHCLLNSPPAPRAKVAFVGLREGEGRSTMSTLDNLVDALLLAAQNLKANGERFIISDGATTFRKFLTPLLDGYAETLPSFSRRQLLDMERSGRLGFRDLLRALTSDEMMTVIRGVPAMAVAKRFVASRLEPFYQRLKA